MKNCLNSLEERQEKDESETCLPAFQETNQLFDLQEASMNDVYRIDSGIDSATVVLGGLTGYDISSRFTVQVKFIESNDRLMTKLGLPLKEALLIMDEKFEELRWVSLRLGGHGVESIKILVALNNQYADEDLIDFINEEIIIQAFNELDHFCDTRINNCIDNYGDKNNRKSTFNVYPNDWRKFSQSVSDAVKNKYVLKKNGIEYLFFYSDEQGHRANLNFDNFLRKFQINPASKDIILYQVHIANTLIPKEGQGFLVSYEKAQKMEIAHTGRIRYYPSSFCETHGSLTYVL